MFAALYSDINSLKYGLLHLTGRSNSQKVDQQKSNMELFQKLNSLELFSLSIQLHQQNQKSRLGYSLE